MHNPLHHAIAEADLRNFIRYDTIHEIADSLNFAGLRIDPYIDLQSNPHHEHWYHAACNVIAPLALHVATTAQPQRRTVRDLAIFIVDPASKALLTTDIAHIARAHRKLAILDHGCAHPERHAYICAMLSRFLDKAASERIMTLDLVRFAFRDDRIEGLDS